MPQAIAHIKSKPTAKIAIKRQPIAFHPSQNIMLIKNAIAKTASEMGGKSLISNFLAFRHSKSCKMKISREDKITKVVVSISNIEIISIKFGTNILQSPHY